MANMSYCRWENTSNDLRDCYNALRDDLDDGKSLQQVYDKLSSYEKQGFNDIVKLLNKIQKILSEEVLKV